MKKAFFLSIAVACMVTASVNSQVYKAVHVDTAGRLSVLLTADELASVTDLALTGFINTDDYSVMKNQMPALTGIDLGAVHSEGDSIPGYAFKTNILSLILPSTITSLGDHALEGCSMLTSLTIPSSVTSIGASAFWGCSGLTSLTIPDLVTGIRDLTFANCNGLTSITLPETITSIGRWAFAACSGLTSINLPDSLLSIGRQAFVACTGIHSLTIPDRITAIEYEAFAGNNFLDSVSIGSSVTTISTYAFAGCSNLKSIIIPPSVDSIAPYAFVSCGAMTSVVIQSTGETSIGEYAFAGNSAITSVIIGPSTGISIGKGAFISSTALKTLKMASPSVTAIGEACFQNTAIDTLVMPSSLTSIGNYAFTNCDSLKSLTFLPSSGLSIGNYAFVSCGSLKSITFLPSSGVTIGEYAFIDCLNLASLNMQSPSVDSIGANCFNNCRNLSFLSMPSSLAYIGDYAFRSCNITGSLTMPASLTYIGENAFSRNQGIDSLTFLPTPGTTIGNNAFYDCDGLVSVRMFSPSVDTIGWGSFDDSENLSELILPSSLASMSPASFGRCYGLKDIRINCIVPPVVPQSTNAFNYVATIGVNLHVPSGTKDAYAAAETWSKFHIVEYDLHLSASPDTLAIADTTGSSEVFEILSSVNWNISLDQPWLIVNPVLGMDTASIGIIAEPNEDTIAREAIITISGENVPLQNVVVLQAPRPSLSVSASELGIGSLEGSTEEFSITSNQDWTIESDQTWLTVSSLAGSGNSMITLTAEANPDTTVRTAILTVKTGRLMPQSIVIAQSPKLFLSVLPDVLEVGSQSGDTASFHITSNTGWAVNADQPWLAVSPSSGSGTGKIVVTAEENIHTASREAIVTILAEGLPEQQIIVVQGSTIQSGFTEISKETIVVYPNPVKDDLHIQGAEGRIMILYDLQGQIILSRKLIVANELIDLALLPRGVYAIKIGNQAWKIVK